MFGWFSQLETSIYQGWSYSSEKGLSGIHLLVIKIAPTSVLKLVGEKHAENLCLWMMQEASRAARRHLVGGFNPSENMKVSWDYDCQYMESHKNHVPNHQPGIPVSQNFVRRHFVGAPPFSLAQPWPSTGSFTVCELERSTIAIIL